MLVPSYYSTLEHWECGQTQSIELPAGSDTYCKYGAEKKRKSYAVTRDNGNAPYGLNVTRGR